MNTDYIYRIHHEKMDPQFISPAVMTALLPLRDIVNRREIIMALRLNGISDGQLNNEFQNAILSGIIQQVKARRSLSFIPRYSLLLKLLTIAFFVILSLISIRYIYLWRKTTQTYPLQFSLAITLIAVALPFLREQFKAWSSPLAGHFSGIRMKGLIPVMVTQVSHNLNTALHLLLSGLIFDLFVIGISVTALTSMKSNEQYLFYYDFFYPAVLVSLIQISVTLNPFLKYDFYYLIDAFLGGTGLRERSHAAFIRIFTAGERNPRSIGLAIYFVMTIIHFVFVGIFFITLALNSYDWLVNTGLTEHIADVIKYFLVTMVSVLGIYQIYRTVMAPFDMLKPVNRNPIGVKLNSAQKVDWLGHPEASGITAGTRFYPAPIMDLFWIQADSFSVEANDAWEKMNALTGQQWSAETHFFMLNPILIQGNYFASQMDMSFRIAGTTPWSAIRDAIIKPTLAYSRTSYFGDCLIVVKETQKPVGLIIKSKQDASVINQKTKHLPEMSIERIAKIKSWPKQFCQDMKLTACISSTDREELIASAHDTLLKTGLVSTGEHGLYLGFRHPSLIIPLGSPSQTTGYKARQLSRAVIEGKCQHLQGYSQRFQVFIPQANLESTSAKQYHYGWRSWDDQLNEGPIFLFDGEIKAMAFHWMTKNNTIASGGYHFLAMLNLVEFLHQVPAKKVILCIDADDMLIYQRKRLDQMTDARFRSLQLALLLSEAGKEVIIWELPGTEGQKQDPDDILSLPDSERQQQLEALLKTLASAKSSGTLFENSSLKDYIKASLLWGEMVQELRAGKECPQAGTLIQDLFNKRSRYCS